MMTNICLAKQHMHTLLQRYIHIIFERYSATINITNDAYGILILILWLHAGKLHAKNIRFSFNRMIQCCVGIIFRPHHENPNLSLIALEEHDSCACFNVCTNIYSAMHRRSKPFTPTNKSLHFEGVPFEEFYNAYGGHQAHNLAEVIARLLFG